MKINWFKEIAQKMQKEAELHADEDKKKKDRYKTYHFIHAE